MSTDYYFFDVFANDHGGVRTRLTGEPNRSYAVIRTRKSGAASHASEVEGLYSTKEEARRVVMELLQQEAQSPGGQGDLYVTHAKLYELHQL